MPRYRIKEAADLLGVSDDTLRRWVESGRISADKDSHGRQTVDGAALAELAASLPDTEDEAARAPVVAHSMRNRFGGLVTKVTRGAVMAQVEIQSGPHRFVSLMSVEAADELGLEPGVRAVAAIKSTNVSVEIPGA